MRQILFALFAMLMWVGCAADVDRRNVEFSNLTGVTWSNVSFWVMSEIPPDDVTPIEWTEIFFVDPLDHRGMTVVEDVPCGFVRVTATNATGVACTHQAAFCADFLILGPEDFDCDGFSPYASIDDVP